MFRGAALLRLPAPKFRVDVELVGRLDTAADVVADELG
jgi:hypothetical protein